MTDDSKRRTMADRVLMLGIAITSEPTDTNPAMPNPDMDHWRVTLRRAGNSRRMTVIFSMGSGHNGRPPMVCDVLDCLASDAASIENTPAFEDWAAEFGYDTDSRKAEKIFKATERQAAKLKRFLGDDFEAVLFETERE